MHLVKYNNSIHYKNTCVTIGKFDGIHLGHRLLLNELDNQCKNGLTPVVFTFTGSETNKIYTLDEEINIFDNLAISELILCDFNDIKNIEAEDFISEVLIKQFDAKMIIAGDDFCFGKNRVGNTELLSEKSTVYGYKIKIFDKIKLDNEIVSSTLIKSYIMSGNITKVNKMLGENYHIIGALHVDKYENVFIPNEVKNKVLLKNGKYPSIINIDNENFNCITEFDEKITINEYGYNKIGDFNCKLEFI